MTKYFQFNAKQFAGGTNPSGCSDTKSRIVGNLHTGKLLELKLYFKGFHTCNFEQNISYSFYYDMPQNSNLLNQFMTFQEISICTLDNF